MVAEALRTLPSLNVLLARIVALPASSACKAKGVVIIRSAGNVDVATTSMTSG
jgi:hypothetical protein